MSAAAPLTAARIDCGVAPSDRARSLACWMVVPSITGSENGTPISMASAPATATAQIVSSQSSPSPPVR